LVYLLLNLLIHYSSLWLDMLGHSVWESERFAAKFEKQIENGVLKELKNSRWEEYELLNVGSKVSDLDSDDMFVRSTWLPAYTWALLQSEEIFCDFLGLYLFAESYLHAFSYLTSPSTSGQRSLGYPNITRRIHHLVYAATVMKISIPAGFKSDFAKEEEPTEPSQKLLVSIADTVSNLLATDLIKLVQDFANEKKLHRRNPDKVSQIQDEFRNMIVPTLEQQTLTDILNAGWNCSLDSDIWDNVSHDKLHEAKDQILQDLILKSMEVSEYHERTKKEQ